MAKNLTDETTTEIEAMETPELYKLIATNERKRRRIKADQKDYAKACKEMENDLDAKTAFAIETMEARDVLQGLAPPPSPNPVVPFPKKSGAKKAPAKRRAEAEA